MQRLNPEKLHVKYLSGASPEQLTLPRCYTLTHSDRTGDLFLSIGREYNKEETSRLYTRLMRDEVLAELYDDGNVMDFKVYCHVSGGIVVGSTKWRYKIFQSELPLVLESIRYGDRALFEKNPDLDKTPVIVSFQSTRKRYNKMEHWGIMAKYK
jgi:hypothetical protein